MKEELKPILKWVGGKRQIIMEIKEKIPKEYGKYYEPFLGGGSVFLSLRPDNAVINDYNSELINVYEVIKEDPKTLINYLREFKNTQEDYYIIRNLDKSDTFADLPKTYRAARTIYLNKTCFNGLYRVNNKGQFNVPYGFYKSPKLTIENEINSLSEYLNSKSIKILNVDYIHSLKYVRKNDLVYLDPPYDPISKTSSFTSYTDKGFDREDQISLKKLCDNLNKKGVKFLLSNSATDFILDLYKEYNITLIDVKRNIAASSKNRKTVKEVLISNYEK